MIDITNLLNAVIVLLTAIITAHLIPAIKNKMDDNTQEDFLKWVKIAVSAAEQLYTDTGAGKRKKAYVVNFLKDKGFIVDESSLDAAIESAVYELNESLKKKD